MESLRELVTRLKMVKAVLEVKDTDKLWEYYLPNNPATDDKIQRVMHDFKVELPTELIEFWKICNGWNCFYQMVPESKRGNLLIGSYNLPSKEQSKEY